jgi:hypothetical protein
MGIMAFTPQGKTINVTAAATAPTPVKGVSTTIGATQYRIINTGTVIAYLGVGNSAADATTNAVKPTSTSTWCIPLLPSTDEIVTFNANVYFTASTDSGTADLYITPGDGL